MATRLRFGRFQNRTVNPKVELRSENQSSTCDVLILLLVCMSGLQFLPVRDSDFSTLHP